MRTRGRDRSRETEAESHQISHRFKRMKTTWRNQEKAKGKMEEKKYLKWYNKLDMVQETWLEMWYIHFCHPLS